MLTSTVIIPSTMILVTLRRRVPATWLTLLTPRTSQPNTSLIPMAFSIETRTLKRSCFENLILLGELWVDLSVCDFMFDHFVRMTVLTPSTRSVLLSRPKPGCRIQILSDKRDRTSCHATVLDLWLPSMSLGIQELEGSSGGSRQL